jgi:hypothetical protein
LPYDVKVKILSTETPLTVLSINSNGVSWIMGDTGYPFVIDWENCKPYLFPLSSMTDEQEKDIFHNGKFYIDHHNSICRFPTNEDDYDFVTMEDCLEIFNKLNKYHFDYRGLIPMGLAIDATGKDIY